MCKIHTAKMSVIAPAIQARALRKAARGPYTDHEDLWQYVQIKQLSPKIVSSRL